MFKKIEIKNFKSLKELSLDLKNLTLFTGINSSGKSSTIQALLLVKQNLETKSYMYETLETLKNSKEYDSKTIDDVFKVLLNTLKIKGEYLDLGAAKNILYSGADTDEIEFKLWLEEGLLSLKSDVKETREEDIMKCTMETEGDVSEVFQENNFSYLSAERITPKSSYDYSKENILKGKLGRMGEFTIHYLSEKKNKDINVKELKHEDASTYQLLENTVYWLSKVSKGINVIPEVNDELQYSSLKYSYGSKEMLPQNIGFGITYVLPIIVAILKAKKGDTVIIENPESHLHPSGQVEIARLCAKASSAGIQIIVETHSDHFLNGVRVAIKEKILSNDKASIYYFSKEDDREETEAKKLEIDECGRIEEWPKGFFDEWDIQLEKLLW